MQYIGRIHELPSEVQDTMQWAEEATGRNTGTTLTLALYYGSPSEIVDAARNVITQLIAEAHERGCSLEDLIQVDGLDARLDEHHISNALYTAHMPDPDLVIRTSANNGSRISCFGRSHTRKSSSPTVSGQIFGAFTCWKQSKATKGANGVLGYWATVSPTRISTRWNRPLRLQKRSCRSLRRSNWRRSRLL